MTTKNWFDEARKVTEVSQSCPYQWIEIQLIYAEEHTGMQEGWLTAPTIKFEKKLGFPFSREPYKLTFPDGKVENGELDIKGSVRKNDGPGGSYKVHFHDALGKQSRKPGKWDKPQS